MIEKWKCVLNRCGTGRKGIRDRELRFIKKGKMFFKKRVLQLQKWQKMRVLRVSHVCCVCVVCVACVACVVVSVLCSCFCQSSVFWVEFAVDRFVAIRGKLRVSEVCSNKLKFSPL